MDCSSKSERTIHPPSALPRRSALAGGKAVKIMSQFSLFVAPSCSACASQSCAGALDPAACPVVVAVVARFHTVAPAAVIPLPRAILGAVIMRLSLLTHADTEDGRSPRASCPACGRAVNLGIVGLDALARVPARLAPPPLARVRCGLWCPICGRPVSPTQSPKVAARLKTWLAGSRA